MEQHQAIVDALRKGDYSDTKNLLNLRALCGKEWQRRGKLSLLEDTCAEHAEPGPFIFRLAMRRNHYQAYVRSREMSCPWAAGKKG
jgi:hypothetical protein